MRFFNKIKAILERKERPFPIWTPIGFPAVTLPDPEIFREPIFVAAKLEDVNVDVVRRIDLERGLNERPTINGVLVFVVPKNQMACFHSDGKNYFAELGAEKWI